MLLSSSFFSCNVWFHRLSDIINFTLIPNAYIDTHVNKRTLSGKEISGAIWNDAPCTNRNRMSNIYRKNYTQQQPYDWVTLCLHLLQCDVDMNPHYYSTEALGFQFSVFSSVHIGSILTNVSDLSMTQSVHLLCKLWCAR